MLENNFMMKIVSSLEKCFCDDNIDNKKEIKKISLLKNEKISFQIAYTIPLIEKEPYPIDFEIGGALKDYIKVYRVVSVPSNMPVSPKGYDDNYLRTTPGLYPDAIMPLHYNNRVSLVPGQLLSLWIDVDLPENIKAGDYCTEFIFKEEGNVLGSKEITVSLLNAELKDFDIYHTQWFYSDCLAEYYNKKVFSREHIEIIKKYIKTAVENGINTILMPVFTPALDTYVGGERLTCQLVDITLEGSEYSFDFSKMDEWIGICKYYNVRYFEIPPFFTQWGAKFAPKFMATVNGEYKQIFGWETDALSPEYLKFLSKFIPALLNRLKSHNIDDCCVFHISDEPDQKDFEHYKSACAFIKKYLKGYTIVDAVWNIDLYKYGALSTPAISVSEVDNFLKEGVEDFWVYYCGGHIKDVSNRFLSMPLYRTRIIGVQLYKYNSKGFLHWAFNYWHNRYSYDNIDPFLDTSGEFFAPSGDTSLVYPAPDGTPYETIRLKAIRDAFQDYRALKSCEELYGRDFVLNLIQEGLDYSLSFTKYPKNDDYLLKLREKVNKYILYKSAN